MVPLVVLLVVIISIVRHLPRRTHSLHNLHARTPHLDLPVQLPNYVLTSMLLVTLAERELQRNLGHKSLGKLHPIQQPRAGPSEHSVFQRVFLTSSLHPTLFSCRFISSLITLQNSLLPHKRPHIVDETSSLPSLSPFLHLLLSLSFSLSLSLLTFLSPSSLKALHTLPLSFLANSHCTQDF